MEVIAAEVSQKLKSAIKAKLMELGAYVDEELPNYVMVMVTNRRSKAEMDRELNLFLGGNTSTFTTWLQSVWTKLEQVTVANLTIEKKKLIDKKKKTKKSTKSSSESEDDRKYKKKRKSSTTIDVSLKETKKRKSIKSENVATETDLFVKESVEEVASSSRNTRDASKIDARLNAMEPDNDIDDSNIAAKKFHEPSILDEDDFLNIKEDFESEFLSDEEIEMKTKLKPPSDSKKPSKVVEKPDVLISNKKHSPTEKPIKDDAVETCDKLKNKDNRAAANSISNLKENDSRSSKPTGKPILIRNRNVVRSRSRSRSRSLTRPSTSPEKIQNHHSAPKTITPSPSDSSLATSNVIKIREKSPVLDARELINRKRALLHAAEHSSKDEEIPLKRNLLVVKNNDNSSIRTHHLTEKENDTRRLRTDVMSDVKSEKQLDIKSGRVISSKLEGKRNVMSDERFSTDSRKKNDKIDLRKIKRTVYVGSDDSEPEEADEKNKFRKSVVNQIVKYIKDEPVTASNAPVIAKAPKINRSKPTSSVRLAGSTLIRKAVADAHKSLTIKEEAYKKKEVQDSKYKISTNIKKEEVKKSVKERLEPLLAEENSNDIEVVSIDSFNAVDPEDEERSISPKVEDESEEPRLNHVPVEVEEYDPSQTMPTFVVTLTGLDPKLYPEDNMELNESLDIESNQNDHLEFLPDFEEKVKAKLPEQCKYYPNCLAGDQCLYHHPTIPCKMFPNCKFGNGCLYMHPKCKFDAVCTRYDCPFLHTVPRMSVPAATRHGAPPSAINAQPCKFYYNCVNPVCPFQHPKICRYDRHCMNKNCTYQHTSLSHVSSFSKDKLKWSKPKNDAEETRHLESNATEA